MSKFDSGVAKVGAAKRGSSPGHQTYGVTDNRGEELWGYR